MTTLKSYHNVFEIRNMRCQVTILILFFLVLCNRSFAESGGWVPYQLPPAQTYNYINFVGDNSLIFIENNSNIVKAFDVFSHQWHEFIVSKTFIYDGNKAGNGAACGNVAMIFYDSLAVGFSALTQTFSSIIYEGTPLLAITEAKGSGDNAAFLITDQYFYVFDAEDAQWRTSTYSPPEPLTSIDSYEFEDYIFINLFGGPSSTDHLMITYSSMTKSFAEIKVILASWEFLEDGFIYWGGDQSICNFGGYSALTGEFDSQTNVLPVQHVLPSYNSYADPCFCGFLTWDEDLGGATLFRRHMYGFDTRSGKMEHNSFDYNPATSGPGWSYSGAEFCLQEVKFYDQGMAIKSELILYLGIKGGFQSAVAIELDQSGLGVPNYFLGSDAFIGYGLVKLMGYDVLNNNSSLVKVPENMFYFYEKYRGAGNHWLSMSGRITDTLRVYSFNSKSDVLQSLEIKADGYIAGYSGTNVHALVVPSSGANTRLFLYSPAYDTWAEYDQGSSTSPLAYVQRDFVSFAYPAMNQTLIFDGLYNQQLWLPLGTNIYDFYRTDDYSYLVFDNTGHYAAYSAIKHDWAEYQGTFASTVWGQKAVKVIGIMSVGTESYSHLVYNVLHNQFESYTLSQEQGYRINVYPGGSTALMTTINGYLLAYDPNLTTDLSEPEEADGRLPLRLELAQNYPNPFNSKTTIWYRIRADYDLPVDVELSIYNLLGQKTATLLEEKQKKGTYTVQWDAGQMASGIYVYYLRVNELKVCRKMVLLR